MSSLWTNIPIFRSFLLGLSFLFIAPLLPPLQPFRKNLTNKIAIVTGANSGVGYGIALGLARQGATIVLACRNETKAIKARNDILSSCPGAKIDILLLDNSSLHSVRSFAKTFKEQYTTLDILIHNAGISGPPNGQDFSSDGFEIMYQTNFLSSFLLTYLLETHLSQNARIIFTSSVGSYAGKFSTTFSLSQTKHQIENGFHTRTQRYGQNKLMQAAFAKTLQRKFDSTTGTGRLAFSFEPGLVKTNIFATQQVPFSEDPVFWALNQMMPYTGIDAEQGAATAVYLATSDGSEVRKDGGRYFDRMKARTHWIDAMSSEMLDRLWIRWCADSEISWT